MSFIKVDKVGKQYDSGSTALYPISISITKNKKLGIVGETGSGKSTLLKIIAGLIAPDSGEVSFKDEILENPNDQLIPGHPAIAYLSQHFELPFFRTVEEIVYDPYQISEEEVNRLYKACHIEHLLQADSQHLSGGEKQRVALAKLLVDAPEVLLLDEPFSNLDLHHQIIIKNTLESIERDFDTTIVLVAHNPLDVLSWADAVLVMKAGKVVQNDTPSNCYNQPKNEYVAGLFGPYNVIDTSKWKRETEVKGKSILRPEAFSITKKKHQGRPGKVLKVAYYGSYDQLTIAIENAQIIVNAGVGVYKTGENVYLTL